MRTIGGRRRQPRQSLQKDLDRGTSTIAAGATAVPMSFVPDQEILVKRIIVAGANEGNFLYEWTLAIHRAGSLVVADRDVSRAVVKTGYHHGDDLYVDFTTSIRLNKGDALGVILENVDTSQALVWKGALIVLYREV